MHPREIHLIGFELSPAVTMLEWGSGGSTLFFSNFVKEIHSFEHSIKWYEKISKQIDQHNIKNINYNYIPSDFEYKGPPPGRTKFPLGDKFRRIPRGAPIKYFKTYVNAVERFDKSKFDVVLVDGRCRLYCAVKALPYLKDGGCVYIHDFFHRKKYHDVLEYYDIVDAVKHTTQTIVKLTKKSREKLPCPSFYDNIKTVDEIAQALRRDPNNFEWSVEYGLRGIH